MKSSCPQWYLGLLLFVAIFSCETLLPLTGLIQLITAFLIYKGFGFSHLLFWERLPPLLIIHQTSPDAVIKKNTVLH